MARSVFSQPPRIQAGGKHAQRTDSSVTLTPILLLGARGSSLRVVTWPLLRPTARPVAWVTILTDCVNKRALPRSRRG